MKNPTKRQQTKAKTARTARNQAGKRGLPVSLYPMSLEEALSGFAQVKMPENIKRRPKQTRDKD
jgi:hypothetical protein